MFLPIRYDPADKISVIEVPPRNPQTRDVLISQLNRDVRERLLNTVGQRVDELVGEVFASLKVPKLLIGPLCFLMGLFVKGDVKRRLAL